jgi:hypothetical protein
VEPAAPGPSAGLLSCPEPGNTTQKAACQTSPAHAVPGVNHRSKCSLDEVEYRPNILAKRPNFPSQRPVSPVLCPEKEGG